MIDLVNIGFNSSADILDKMKRDRATMMEAILSQEEMKIKDSIMNFYSCGYQIKDWLKAEGLLGVENYINENLELRICADLCNGAKHKILTGTRRESGDPFSAVVPAEITWDSTAYTIDSSLGINSTTYKIELESGDGFEILHFANRVVELWENFIGV